MAVDYNGLRPCPFCGHPAKGRTIEDEEIVELEAIYLVECGTCGAQGSQGDTPMAAEEWWNGDHFETGRLEYLADAE